MRLETRVAKKSRRRSRRHGWKLVVGKLHQHQIYLLVGLGLCMMVAAGFVLARSSPAGDDWRIEVMDAGHQVIREVVRGDIRPTFGGVEETHIEELAGGKYKVGGWVDLIFDQGHVERQHFSCTLYRDDSGGWVAEDVSVTPE